MKQKNVIVIGAGLAGLSCAVELMERGCIPLVLESYPFVGGRTASWEDDGMHIETGLHRYLGFYTHLPKLLRKSGLKLRKVVFWEDAVDMRLPDGPKATFHASVHRPVRTLRSFLFNNHYINWQDKRQLAKMFSLGLKDYFLHPKKLKNISVDEYAAKRRVGKRAHDRVLVPLTDGIFFTPPDQYAAYNLFGLIAPYLPHLWRFRIGGFRGGMTEVMCAPIAEHIRQKGGEVRTSSEVATLLQKDGRVVGVRLMDGTEIKADWVVLAASLEGAKRLTKPFERQKWSRNLQTLGSVPVVTLHLELKKPAIRYDRTTFGPTTPLTSFSEESRTTFSSSKGRLSIILSPPDKYLNMDTEAMTEEAVRTLKRLGIDISGKIKGVRKVEIPMDFYSLAPGMDQLRPRQRLRVPGLTLAGDYTKQRYLGTMEGAVYSGKRAARIVGRALT